MYSKQHSSLAIVLFAIHFAGAKGQDGEKCYDDTILDAIDRLGVALSNTPTLTTGREPQMELVVRCKERFSQVCSSILFDSSYGAHSRDIYNFALASNYYVHGKVCIQLAEHQFIEPTIERSRVPRDNMVIGSLRAMRQQLTDTTLNDNHAFITQMRTNRFAATVVLFANEYWRVCGGVQQQNLRPVCAALSNAGYIGGAISNPNRPVFVSHAARDAEIVMAIDVLGQRILFQGQMYPYFQDDIDVVQKYNARFTQVCNAILYGGTYGQYPLGIYNFLSYRYVEHRRVCNDLINLKLLAGSANLAGIPQEKLVYDALFEIGNRIRFTETPRDVIQMMKRNLITVTMALYALDFGRVCDGLANNTPVQMDNQHTMTYKMACRKLAGAGYLRRLYFVSTLDASAKLYHGESSQGKNM